MDFGPCLYQRVKRFDFSLACDERAKYGGDGKEEPVVRFDLTRGLGAQDVDDRIGRARRAGDIGHRTLAFYLADCADRRLHQVFGHSSIVPYAIKRHELSRRVARDLVAAGRALQELVKIDAAFIEGDLPWSKVRAIAKVADLDTEEDWIAFAKTHPVDEVEKEASLAQKGQKPREHRKGLPEVRFKVQLWVSELLNEQTVLARQKLGAELGREPKDEEFAGALLDAYLRRPTEYAGQASDSLYRVVLDYRPADGAAFIRSDDGPVPVGDAEKAAILCDAGVAEHDGKPHAGHAPPASEYVRRKIHGRDGWRCRVCGSRVQLMVHHIVYRENGGSNAFSNLMSLCKGCHVLVHGNFLGIEGKAPHALVFRDRTGAITSNPAALVHDGGARLEIGSPSGPAGPVDGARTEAGPTEEGATRSVTEPYAPTVDFDRLPAEEDAAWLERHFHLVSADPRQTGYRIEPGCAAQVPSQTSSDRSPAEAADDGSTTSPDRLGAGSSDAVQSGPGGPPNSGFSAEKRDPLRPETFSEVVGQKAAVSSLRLAVEAAQASGEMPDHVLLSGRPGLGKTTLAVAFARELGGRLRVIDATTLDSPLALIGHLIAARDGDVIFLDEIHALPPRLAELLYGALEDGAINMPFSDGVRTKNLRVRLAKVTFIGATTNPGRMPEPLVARFPMCEELEPYGEEDLAEIVRRAAGRNGLAVAGEAALILARASLGCARTAINLYRCLRRILRARRVSCASAELAREALAAARVDHRGLGAVHQRILELLRVHGRPMAVRRLARAAGLTLESFRTLYEPALFQIGAIIPTPRGMGLGRMAHRPG